MRKKQEKAKITLMEYGPDRVREKRAASVSELLPLKEAPGIAWINIDGLHDTGVIEEIGEVFKIHPMILEDILHTMTRPKVEALDDGIFLVFNLLGRKEGGGIFSEQFSIVLGRDFVISFQERENQLFDPLMDRIRNEKSRIRKKGPITWPMPSWIRWWTAILSFLKPLRKRWRPWRKSCSFPCPGKPSSPSMI
nr:hypothetical protein [Desulfobacula sp.]